MRMRHIVICGLPALYFPNSHKRHDFRKTNSEQKMCFYFLYNVFSETFLILRRTERDMIKNV